MQLQSRWDSEKSKVKASRLPQHPVFSQRRGFEIHKICNGESRPSHSLIQRQTAQGLLLIN
jgi:hypothetical protein